ncbi:NAD(+)/NADH kinase [Bacteriovorax sp. BSW11_IV]|uniref:NAD(+)/NADH kinase n=1 Tax=Bacteriovorax sp. BSW11_IV TaxID=1353529 RepID=UPI000389E720|nr:NAD(+)/NADH kinase [Bacteriovorax sp. BSW11_IV]EQC44840.1 NAD(+)/NADH kinase [Bacteriovorax sp. BSW11_IV]
MSSKIKNVAVIIKPKVIGELATILPNLTEWLHRKKVNVAFSINDQDRIKKIYKAQLKNVSFLDFENLLKSSDLVITLGGDGTFIGVARKCNKDAPPIFGVNMGRLGFITEFSKHEFYESLAQTLEGKFETLKLNLFQVQVFKKEKSLFKGHFLNDAVVNKNDISRMFTLAVESEDENIYNLAGDGLIISSPIGSTAYSLAAGGPIIHPSVGSMALTPICAHSLTHRPMVISDRSKIFVRPLQESGVITLTLDGQEAYDLKPGERIQITRSSRFVTLVKNPERTYYHTLKEKFKHGRRDA